MRMMTVQTEKEGRPYTLATLLLESDEAEDDFQHRVDHAIATHETHVVSEGKALVEFFPRGKLVKTTTLFNDEVCVTQRCSVK